MVKGYEFAKDQYVAFTPEEIKALEEVGTHSVEISEFVPIESIDPVYFDKTYYLAPDKGAAKPYGLLTEALKEVEALRGRSLGGARQGVHRDAAADRRCADDAAAAFRGRRASGDARSKSPKPDVKPQELKLAQQLIEQQTSETFDPDRVHAMRCAGRIEAAIQKKVEGQEISVSEIAPGGRRQGHRPDGGTARQPREDRSRPRRRPPSSVRARRRSASSKPAKTARKASRR